MGQTAGQGSHTRQGEPASWSAVDAAEFLTRPTTDDHKYSRGVLGLRTGSSAYPGAAVLGAEAAWRAGAGLVRFVPQRGDAPPPFGLPTPAAAVLAARPETVISWGGDPCDAWLLGSGTSAQRRSTAERQALVALLAGQAPVVADAGAIDRELLRAAGDRRAPTIITPHAGEFARLWESLGQRPRPTRDADAAAELAAHLDITVLLKGSVTIAASPSGELFESGPATPWLATAGTGDVLAGILGALVAAHASAVRLDPELLAQLGATAALLHDVAARIASGDDAQPASGRPVTALDVARAIPAAFERLSPRGAM